MSAAYQLTDRDRGYDDLMAVARRRAPTLVVGIMAKHAELLDAAIAAEFGTRTEPQRSWLRQWFDEKRVENLARLREAARRTLAGEDADRVLAEVGAQMVAEIRDRISSGIAPPLAATTVEQRAWSTSVPPLFGLEQAIESEVRP